MWLLVLMPVLGMATLVGAGFEVRTQRRLRREGVRAWGTVVRHERGNEPESRTRFAVVAFTAEDGTVHECHSVQSGTRRWPVGREVPVVHPPFAPARARIDLPAQHAIRVAVLVVVGVALSVVPLLPQAR